MLSARRREALRMWLLGRLERLGLVELSRRSIGLVLVLRRERIGLRLASGPSLITPWSLWRELRLGLDRWSLLPCGRRSLTIPLCPIRRRSISSVPRCTASRSIRRLARSCLRLSGLLYWGLVPLPIRLGLGLMLRLLGLEIRVLRSGAIAVVRIWVRRTRRPCCWCCIGVGRTSDADALRLFALAQPFPSLFLRSIHRARHSRRQVIR
jgi:hypothetical protein